MNSQSQKQHGTRLPQKTGVSFAASLTFENIHHRYQKTEILKGIDLSIEPGEVLSLLGPSGSGKTTMLRIAAGIERQSKGRLLLDGVEISGPKKSLPPEKRGIGLMFQDFALFPHMTLLENVKYGLTALSQSEAKRQAMSALERVGLAYHKDSYPHLLSGGEQQRVALARAIAPRPSVLLMDEPFSGLDSRLKESIRNDTLSILREAKVTTIMVTHDASEAMQMSDKIALLRDGVLVQVGSGKELYESPRDLFTAGFFSNLNVLRAQVKSGMASTPLGDFDASQFDEGATLNVVARQSALSPDREHGSILARVVAKRFVGRFEQVTLAVSGCDDLVQASVRTGTLEGNASDVRLKINERDVFLFETDD